MTRFTLIGAGLTMLIVGVLHLVNPQMMLDSPGIKLQSVSHFHMVRAAYGGSFLGTAALFMLGAFRPDYRRMSLIALCCLFSGWIIGRVFSIVVDGMPAELYIRVLGTEIFFLILAAVALRTAR